MEIEIKQNKYIDSLKYINENIDYIISTNSNVNNMILNTKLGSILIDFKNVELINDTNNNDKRIIGKYQYKKQTVDIIVDTMMAFNDNRIIFNDDNKQIIELIIKDDNYMLI